MALIDATAGAGKLTKYSDVSIVVKGPEDDPRSYALRSAMGMGGSEVRLPHLSAGVDRVTSDESPYGHLEVGYTYTPDPNNPNKMIPTPSDPNKFRRIEEDARKRRRKWKGSNVIPSAAIEELQKSLQENSELQSDDEELPVQPVISNEPAPVVSSIIHSLQLPEPPVAPRRPPKPLKRITLSGPHGLFRGKVLEVVRDQQQIICITEEDAGFMVPPLDGTVLKLNTEGVVADVCSTGVNFVYDGKLFVVFMTQED